MFAVSDMRYDTDWFNGKRVTVMGLGLHGGGLGVATWLIRHGAKVLVTDMKDTHALASSVREIEKAYAVTSRAKSVRTYRPRYVLGRHDARDFSVTDMVIQNPGVPRENPYLAIARKAGIPVETDVSLFFMMCPFPITAVTGTKGKTSTTAMIGEMCARHDARTVVAGNIRVSVMDALDDLIRIATKGGTPTPVILELSSWQVEGLRPHRMSPHVGVVTNIKRDHLDRYRDMTDYAKAKEGLVNFQKQGDVAVLNHDDPKVGKMAGKRHRLLWFTGKSLPGGKDGCYIRGGKIRLRIADEVMDIAPVSAVRVKGAPGVMNAVAACAAAFATGIPVSAIRKGLRSFAGVPGRMEEVAKSKGVVFVNDTTATTPDAVIAALDAYKAKRRHVILIAGGADKKLLFADMARAIGKHVKHLVLLDGTATPKLEKALLGVRSAVPLGPASSMRAAVKEAMRHAGKGDIVLLSPGCASFGMFVNEFDRGDRFVEEVRRLK